MLYGLVQVYFFLRFLFSHPYFVNFLCVTFDIMCKRFSAKVTGHVRKEANTHPHTFSLAWPHCLNEGKLCLFTLVCLMYVCMYVHEILAYIVLKFE